MSQRCSHSLLCLVLAAGAAVCTLPAGAGCPLIDAGIPVAEDDAAYQSGLAAGVFIRDKHGDPYIGQVRAAEDNTHGCSHRVQLRFAVNDGRQAMQYLAERCSATCANEMRKA